MSRGKAENKEELWSKMAHSGGDHKMAARGALREFVGGFQLNTRSEIINLIR